jgi:hypothetical protein
MLDGFVTTHTIVISGNLHILWDYQIYNIWDIMILILLNPDLPPQRLTVGLLTTTLNLVFRWLQKISSI